MQFVHDFDPARSMAVGLGVRVMVLAPSGDDPLIGRLAGLGGAVEVETEFYTAMAAVLDDPTGYGLLVVQCDGLGGAALGARAMTTLNAENMRLPVILVSRDFQEQDFPQNRGAAVCLRAPLSSLSLRVGFEHALRDRLLRHAA